MQQMEATTMNRAERKRLEAVVETLATIGNRGESVAEVAHDARNMVTALGLYCDLLEEPGVLAYPFAHYGSELRLVAAASRRLVEKLVTIDTDQNVLTSGQAHTKRDGGDRKQLASTGLASMGNEWMKGWDPTPSAPIGSLADELLANHNLLAALAGSSITLTVDVDRGARPVWMTGEDLTRVLVNLVKNAGEAMQSGGRLEIGLREIPAGAGALESLVLTVEDSGPGMPEEAQTNLFQSGYTTRGKDAAAAGSKAAQHRGLGLAISRSIVEAAGGRIFASNRPEGGARFQIELPVRKVAAKLK